MNEYKPENENNTINLNPIDYSSTSTKEKPVKSQQEKMVTANYAKVFIWFGIGLLITGVIAFGLPNIFWFASNENIDNYIIAYYVMMAVAFVGIFPLSIMMSISTTFRNNKAFIKVTYILYTIFMGILVSGIMLTILALTDVYDISFINVVASAFLITAGLFVIMGLIGVFTKKINKAVPILITLVVGALILSLVNFFLQVDWITWVVDFVLFIWILLVTAIDMHNVSKIAQRVDFKEESNLAIYLAYTLYVDFVYMFIRVVYYVLILYSRSSKNK